MVEPVTIALHGVSLAPIHGGETALVMGCGLIGLIVIQVLRLKGCQRIIAADLDENRLRLAKQLGADITVNPVNSDVASVITELTHTQGVDLALDVVGFSQSINTCVASLKKSGHLVLIGNFQPRIEVSLSTIITRQITLVGSCASCGEYPAGLELINNGSIQIDELISQVSPLAEGPYWFDQLYHKKQDLMKVILAP